MTQYVEKALKHLTGKSDIDDVSTEDLERIATEHPYFSVSQILLSKKLKLAQAPSFLAQVQKTALYFTNPYWLHYQLMKEEPTIHLTKPGEENISTKGELENDEMTASDLEVTEDGTIKSNKEESSVGLPLEEPIQEETEKGVANFKDDQTTEIANKQDDGVITEKETAGEEQLAVVDTSDEIQHTDTSETSSDEHLPEQLINAPNQQSEEVEKAAPEEKNPHESTDATNEAVVDEQHAPTNIQHFQYTEEHSLLSLEDTYTLRPAENEFLETPPIDESSNPVAGNSPAIQETHTSNFEQTPQGSQDVHELDHPLISGDTTNDSLAGLTAEENLIDNEQNKVAELYPASVPDVTTDIEYNPEETDLTPTEEITKEETAIEKSATDESITEDIAPDPFHPETEEILEEQEQLKVDNELTPTDLTKNETLSGEKESEVVTNEAAPLLENTVDVKEADREENEVSATPAASPSTNQTVEVSNNQPAQTETSEPLIPIEPYYTVDYFASQGIRFTPEKDPQDKLGKQLKSFTQWLKHMKRLGPEDAAVAKEDQQLETTIPAIADSSNTPRDVVTEAMAEVLEKQGKTEQAIEVYNKLSFLNPDKSAYFADKIKNIKVL